MGNTVNFELVLYTEKDDRQTMIAIKKMLEHQFRHNAQLRPFQMVELTKKK